MGLGLYSSPNENSLISTSNPFSVTFDGRIGGAQDRLLYVRNDDSRLWYSNISLSVVDLLGDSIVDGSVDGWIWKLMEKDIPPNNDQWGLISPANVISFSTDLGNSALSDLITYLSVWVRVQVPRNQRIQTIVDVVFRLQAQENLI